MSSLWTPDGEHPIDRDSPEASDAPSGAADPDIDPQTADRAEEILADLADARRRVAEAPVEVVIVNHAMGLYELGAIHLSNEPPDLDKAHLAIDAFAALVGLGDRLGSDAPTLRDALAQIQMAFVQVKARVNEQGAPDGDAGH